MNHRLTIAAAVAVILGSVSEYVLITGGGWLAASIGAVIVVAGAGTLTRLAPNHAAISATVLAVIACVPVLADRSLLIKLAGLVIIACCAASASRLRAAKPVADAVTYLAALLLYLNLTLSRGSWVLVIPTAKSLRYLMTLVHQGSTLAGASPPVDGKPGVILLAAASIGLTAIVVDIIAVRLDKPAIAGLPLLVLYMAPIATAAKPSGLGAVLTFLLAATGYLGLLASDGRNRLRGWGRIVTVWHYSGEDDRIGGADIRGLAATGRRIGLAAVCAAIVAPLLLPTLNLHRLFGHGSGGHSVVNAGLPNPIDQLHALLTDSTVAPVLSYRSNNGNAGQYLQVYVLNYAATAGKWTLVDPSPSTTVSAKGLSQPPGLASTTPFTLTNTTVQLDHLTGPSSGYNFAVFFLPVPYWPAKLSAPGSWMESDGSLMIYSGNADQSGMRYSVTNGQPVLTPAEEATAAVTPIPTSMNSYMGFRSSVTPALKRIARQVTKGARTPFEKAVDLEKYFQSSQFTYALQGVNLPDTPQGLLTFLTASKRGFCEQFAFAMAALARLVGIPSRIAIGYTSGTNEHGTWKVTTADAHAWPELYFPGLGWLRFEPTPGGPNGQGTAQQPSYALQGGGGRSQPGSTSPGKTKNSGGITGKQPDGTHVRVPNPDPLAPHNAPGSSGVKNPVPVGQILLGLLALLIVVGFVPGTARVVIRRRRWRAAGDDASLARAAWQEVCADLDDFGLTRRLSESPRAMARRISVDVDIDESARRAISRIAIVVERCRYAPVPASAEGVHADVAEFRRSLARNAGVIWRLRARLVPASVIGPAVNKVSRTVGQRTGWLPSFGDSQLT